MPFDGGLSSAPPRPAAPARPAPSIGSGVAAVVHPTPTVGSGVAAVVPQTPAPVAPAAAAVSHIAAGITQAAPHLAASVGYPQAIKDVFNAQSIPQKGAVLRNILATPDLWKTTEGASVLQAWRAEPSSVKAAIAPYLKAPTGPAGPTGLIGSLNPPADTGLGVGGGQGVAFGIQHPLGTGPGGTTLFDTIGRGVSGAIGGGLSDAWHALNTPLGKGGPPASSSGGGLLGTATMFAPQGGAKSAGHFLGNAASDAINLPSNTVQGLYKVGSDVVAGHIGKAVGDVVDPFIQMAENPAAAFYKHPLNSAIMLGGPEAAIGRGVGSVMRSGALGDTAASLASRARDDLHVGMVGDKPSPITESRTYSGNVLTKAAQVAWEKHLQARGLDPNVARPAPGWMPSGLAYATRTGIDAKLQRNMDTMAAVSQMGRREEGGVVKAKLNTWRPPANGENVVTHILQGVIRSPKTAVADIGREIDRIKANMDRSRSPANRMARAQIADLQKAAADPKALAAAFDTAAKIRPILQQHDKILVEKGILDPGQAARSKVMPYAMAHMGAKPGSGIPAQFHGDQAVLSGLERADGSRITTQEIYDHLKANNVPDPGYVGHFPDKTSARNFYQRYKLARGGEGMKRSGAAFLRGNYDHSYAGLVGQTARSVERVTRAELHDTILHQTGILKPIYRATTDGRMVKAGERPFRNVAQAERYAYAASHNADHSEKPGRLDLVPIVISPKNSLETALSRNTVASMDHTAMETKVLSDAMSPASLKNATNNIALIPKTIAERAMEQYAPQGALGRGLGKVTQQFRRTVLPYSTHWMLQIGTEAGLRAAVGGVLDPRNLVAGRQLMKNLLTTREGRASLREMTGATMYGMHHNLGVFNPNESGFSRFVHNAPLVRQLVSAHNHYADGVSAAMIWLEHQARLMGLGKNARMELQNFTGKYQLGIKLQSQNLATLVGHLKTDPALVSRFGRSIDDTFGSYAKLTPQLRAATQSVTPFLPWYLNAAKFVLWTLPAKHPVASSLLASLRATVAQDVQDGKQQPLNAYAAQQLARLSPFGIFNPPTSPGPGGVAADAAGELASTILPQITGPLYNLAGASSFGDGPLTGPHGYVKGGSPQATGAAAETLLESLMPLASYARKGIAGGRSTYGASTLWDPEPKPGKAGSAGQVANRILNPFYSFESALHNPPKTAAQKKAAKKTVGFAPTSGFAPTNRFAPTSGLAPTNSFAPTP